VFFCVEWQKLQVAETVLKKVAWRKWQGSYRAKLLIVKYRLIYFVCIISVT